MDEKEKDVLVGKEWAERVWKENYLNEPPVDIYSLVQNYGLSVWEKNYADTISIIKR